MYDKRQSSCFKQENKDSPDCSSYVRNPIFNTNNKEKIWFTKSKEKQNQYYKTENA